MGDSEESKQMVAGLGKRISALRAKHGMTQEQLSTLADLSPITLSKIERSKSVPTLDILLRIARVLEVSPDHLTGWIPSTLQGEARDRELLFQKLRDASDAHSTKWLKALVDFAQVDE